MKPTKNFSASYLDDTGKLQYKAFATLGELLQFLAKQKSAEAATLPKSK